MAIQVEKIREDDPVTSPVKEKIRAFTGLKSDANFLPLVACFQRSSASFQTFVSNSKWSLREAACLARRLPASFFLYITCVCIRACFSAEERRLQRVRAVQGVGLHALGRGLFT